MAIKSPRDLGNDTSFATILRGMPVSFRLESGVVIVLLGNNVASCQCANVLKSFDSAQVRARR